MVRTHGRVPGGGAVVVAMGKLGGREMTAASDLDLIVVYDFDAQATQSDGPSPLPADPVLHAADAAPDQRAGLADRRRHALRGRHAAAALGPERPGGHAALELHRLPAERSLDVGAPGTDARARRLRCRRRFAARVEAAIREALTCPATAPRSPPTSAICGRASTRRRAPRTSGT